MFKTEMNVERPLLALALEKVSLLLQRLSVGVGRVAGSESVLARWCWDPVVELCEKLKEVESKENGYED